MRHHDRQHRHCGRCTTPSTSPARAATAVATTAAKRRACSTGRRRGCARSRPNEPVDDTARRRCPALLTAATRVEGPDGHVERYRCQATEMLAPPPSRCRAATSRSTSRTFVPATSASRWSLRALSRGDVQRLSTTSAARYLPSRLRFRDGRRWGALTGTVGRSDADRAQRPAAGRAGAHQVATRGAARRSTRHAQPWARLRRRDGPLLRHHDPRRQARRPHHRREHRRRCST